MGNDSYELLCVHLEERAQAAGLVRETLPLRVRNSLFSTHPTTAFVESGKWDRAEADRKAGLSQ